MTDGIIRSKAGFTAVQNTVAKNRRLSLKAKGLYLVIQAYITIPNSSFKKSDFFNMVCEGEKAFDRSWNELKESGYLKTHIHTQNGKFITEYELMDVADEGPHTFYYDKEDKVCRTNLDNTKTGKGCGVSGRQGESRTPQKGDTVKENSRIPQNGTGGNGRYGNGSNGKGDNNNNTLKEIKSINNKTGNNTHHHQEQSNNGSVMVDDEEKLRKRIDFERLLREHPANRKVLEYIVKVMCEMLSENNHQIMLSKNRFESRESVQDRLRKICFEDIEFLLAHLPDEKDCNIVNPNGFMRTCLFNCAGRKEEVCWTKQIRNKSGGGHEYDFDSLMRQITESG